MGAVVIVVLVSTAAFMAVCFSDARRRRRDAPMTTFAASIAALERIAAERHNDGVRAAVHYGENVHSLDEYRRQRSARPLQERVRFVDARPTRGARMAARQSHERKVQVWQPRRTTAMTPP